jgi:hypothetical protein
MEGELGTEGVHLDGGREGCSHPGVGVLASEVRFPLSTETFHLYISTFSSNARWVDVAATPATPAPPPSHRRVHHGIFGGKQELGVCGRGGNK